MESARADAMSIISELRTLVFLRRIARAMERQAESLDELRQIERDRWARENRIRPAKVRPTEVAAFDVDAANEQWRKELEAAEYGGVLEDRTK